MKLVVTNEDDNDIAIGRVAKVTLRGSREQQRDKLSYYTNICMTSSVSTL